MARWAKAAAVTIPLAAAFLFGGKMAFDTLYSKQEAIVPPKVQLSQDQSVQTQAEPPPETPSTIYFKPWPENDRVSSKTNLVIFVLTETRGEIVEGHFKDQIEISQIKVPSGNRHRTLTFKDAHLHFELILDREPFDNIKFVAFKDQKTLVDNTKLVAEKFAALPEKTQVYYAKKGSKVVLSPEDLKGYSTKINSKLEDFTKWINGDEPKQIFREAFDKR